MRFVTNSGSLQMCVLYRVSGLAGIWRWSLVNPSPVWGWEYLGVSRILGSPTSWLIPLIYTWHRDTSPARFPIGSRTSTRRKIRTGHPLVCRRRMENTPNGSRQGPASADRSGRWLGAAQQVWVRLPFPLSPPSISDTLHRPFPASSTLVHGVYDDPRCHASRFQPLGRCGGPPLFGDEFMCISGIGRLRVLE